MARFAEVKSGRKAERPELANALQLAKVTGPILVIAKQDWLSRNDVFLLALRNSGVTFVATDMPKANDQTVGVIALVGLAKRETIPRQPRKRSRSRRHAE